MSFACKAEKPHIARFLHHIKARSMAVQPACSQCTGTIQILSS
jgi:hypothetical protein